MIDWLIDWYGVHNVLRVAQTHRLTHGWTGHVNPDNRMPAARKVSEGGGIKHLVFNKTFLHNTHDCFLMIQYHLPMHINWRWTSVGIVNGSGDLFPRHWTADFHMLLITPFWTTEYHRELDGVIAQGYRCCCRTTFSLLNNSDNNCAHLHQLDNSHQKFVLINFHRHFLGDAFISNIVHMQ